MQTAGKTKFAARMAGHVSEQIDAACPITLETGQFAWLGLGTFHFVLTKSSLMGKPTGDPLARVSYAEVAHARLTEGKLTLRVDLDLFDGRHLAFEAKRLGQNKPNVDVLGLLHSRVEKSI